MRTLLSLLNSIDLQGRAYPSVAAFLAAKLPEAPGCLVLDVRLPGISGLDFQAQLTEKGIHLPVVLMSGHGDVPMSVQGMKAGAVDFLTKPFRAQDMLDAINVAIERDEARWRPRRIRPTSNENSKVCRRVSERLCFSSPPAR